ncbi:uncharacterized protein [Littorina saxatilis]|uniref:THD domain-containing protein n=1 Tax=Littorina saxatilis TaxID=31220 RepID=A0AAN9AQA7_9CAEN
MDPSYRGMPSWMSPRLREVLDQDNISMRSDGELMVTSSLDSTFRSYASPLPVRRAGMVHAASYQGFGLSVRNMSEDNDYLPIENIRASMREECQKLEATNRRLRCFYNILVTACVLVALLYFATVVYLFNVLPSTKTEFCVEKEEILNFKNIWDKDDRTDVLEFLSNSGFTYSGTTFCFHSLKWVPDIMGKINSAIRESVDYIGKQQKNINETVNRYLSGNNTCNAGNRSSETNPVFAHLFLNVTATKMTGTGALKWVPGGNTVSSRRNVNISQSGGKLVITHSGFYFIYSRVTFRDSVTGTLHSVFKNTEERRRKLLESREGPASYLQGVFMLTEGDRVSVEAKVSDLNTDSSQQKSTYFGLYLIRT